MVSQAVPQSGWIEFKDLAAVGEEYRQAFVLAQAALNAILARQPSMPAVLEGRTVRGVLIDASTTDIDGELGILGRAGPTLVRTQSGLPVSGVMQFDNADLGRLKAKGELEDVVLHEMFHVLGAGTLWVRKGLLLGGDSNDPQFIGVQALREYHVLLGHEDVSSIPVANTGGPGTKNGHWRETTFGTELNTGFLNGAHRPLSRMSIAALGDLGYSDPDLQKAEPYSLPNVVQLQSLRSEDRCCGKIERPSFGELSA